jgi:hypothetical protein
MRQRNRQQTDHVLLMALACGSSIENAAVKAGVGVHMVRRRLSSPDFARKLRDMKAGMVQRTAAVLTAAASEAVKTLLELQAPTSPPNVRLHAARAIIELGSKLRETVELQDRIAALEEQMGEESQPQLFVPAPVEPESTVIS